MRTKNVAAALAGAGLLGAVGLGVAGLRGAGTPAPEPPQAALAAGEDVRIGSIQLTTGVRLQYAEAGPKDGEPMLFLHGYTDSWFSYSQVLDRLPAGVRGLALTQRGHGDSERPECCYRLEDFVADAVAFLDALGIRKATIVGHSAGSFTAQALALRHPERVSRLVLVGSGTHAATEPVRGFFEQAVQPLVDPVPVEFIREFQASTAFQPLAPEFLDRIVAESARLPARVWRDVLADLLAVDLRGELHRIRVPTLIVWGDRDELFPLEEQQALAARIPGAKLLVYQETGHAPHWERPDRFVRDLAQFVQGGATR